MSINIAESILKEGCLNQKDIAERFTNSYRWRRGYGPSTAKLLKRIRRGQTWEEASKSVYPSGSYGNGAAMRAPVLALFFPNDVKALIHATQRTAEITHAHPLGIEGAILISLATRELLHKNTPKQVFSSLKQHCQAPEFIDKLNLAQFFLKESKNITPQEMKRTLGNGITATTSCVSALYLSLRFLNEDMTQIIQFAKSCGGDVDTICAMAGALWGAYNGSNNLPEIQTESKDYICYVAAKIFNLLYTKSLI